MRITQRQLQAVEAYFVAGSTKGAAQQLGISWHTVKKHLDDVRERLGVTTTQEAIHILAAEGQLGLPQLGR
jgi:DNA-binding CsgD family transcriptional regulator